MAPEAILVSDDSNRPSTVLYQRESEEQSHARKRTVSQPERFYGSSSTPSPVNQQPDEDNKPLPSKGKAYIKWMGDIVGSAWNGGTTFQRPREGIDYH